MVTARTNNQHRSQRTPALGLRLLLLAGPQHLILVIDHRENHLDAVRRAIGCDRLSAAGRGRRTSRHVALDWRDSAAKAAMNFAWRTAASTLNACLPTPGCKDIRRSRPKTRVCAAMLEARTRVTDEVRVAGIMSVSANPFRHVLVIDKGQNDGVYDGQAMVDANGVVGQVIETGYSRHRQC